MRRLAPKVRNPYTNEEKSILVLWKIVEDALWGKDPHDSVKVETRKKIFGRELVSASTIRMSQLSIQSKFTPSEWEEMPLNKRGEWAAYYNLQNIEEIMKRYYDIVDDYLKERSKDIADKNKSA